MVSNPSRWEEKDCRHDQKKLDDFRNKSIDRATCYITITMRKLRLRAGAICFLYYLLARRRRHNIKNLHEKLDPS
jgi:hypothetical protein